MKDFTIVTEIQGIGVATAAELSSHHISYIEDLLALPESHMIIGLESVDGLNQENLRRNYLPQARFLRIDGIDGQYAEGLAASGFRTYRDIAFTDSSIIQRSLLEMIEIGRIPDSAAESDITRWQLEAARLMQGGSVHVTVSNSQGPIESADVHINGNGFSGLSQAIRLSTESQGKVFLDGIAPGSRQLAIAASGHQQTFVTVSFKAGSRTQIRVSLLMGEDKPLFEIDEFQGEIIPKIPSTAQVVNRAYELEQLPSVPVFFVYEIRKTTVVLHSLWYRLRNDEVEVPNITIEKTQITGEMKQRAVVYPVADGKFGIQESVTPQEYRSAFIAERLQA